MKKVFLIIFMFIFAVQMMPMSEAGTFRADAKTKRIPAGTTFQLEFLQGVNTYTGHAGDSFSATLKNEQSSDTSVILPLGTVVRGCIQEVKTAKICSRGAKLYLYFDHVVTPTGRQIPLEMAVSQYDSIYYDGGLYKSLGYGSAIKENYQKGIDITKNAVNYGLKAGESAPGMQYLTTPFCAIGGGIGSVGYFLGTSVASIFKKGKEVYINQGDIITVRLINPIDVPVY